MFIFDEMTGKLRERAELGCGCCFPTLGENWGPILGAICLFEVVSMVAAPPIFFVCTGLTGAIPAFVGMSRILVEEETGGTAVVGGLGRIEFMNWRVKTK